MEKISGREVKTWVREVEKLTDKQKMILDLIKNNPSISKKEMSETIGIRPSFIDKNITTLKEKGYLKRLGPAKGGHWEIIINKNHKFRKTQHQIIIAKSHFHPAHSKPFYPVHTSYIKEYIIKVKEHGFKRRACRF
ncbi:MAG: winged helix-turn-helix transcriptional regulator [ANME-2 cluster archaeon]|nr:winged helix-turn-helix transcriptional regulator [ANME-2 cluster archaeon]MBC2702547.1 winged helix-turn-helix transcriptional regulator [ANME-2 cluster archaeon]MBC2708894.1 winged helix-turn-helix transcriptional regulator [ANME-2 cluster archaeon]MBC2746788.1 winged helix-turn-helix transcriptional regulator [ANME-2 cluster archaeon]